MTEAFYHIGVKEIGGNNRGPMVEQFQAAVGPVGKYQPWCASFVWFCINRVGAEKCCLKKTAHVMTMWSSAPLYARKKYGAPGYLMVWRKYSADGKPMADGHIGIVREHMHGTVYSCVEGNTGDDSGVSRDGDGVYLKTRNSGARGSMRCVGFLDPWAAP